MNKNTGETKMKNELNIVDLIALATHKPELFQDKEQLKFMLELKNTIVDVWVKDFEKGTA
jgi:hypothetical protein